MTIKINIIMSTGKVDGMNPVNCVRTIMDK